MFSSQVSFAVVNLGISSLGLRSLKEISDGYVRIINNTKLCYVQTLNWLQLFKSTKQSHFITKSKPDTECSKYFITVSSIYILCGIIFEVFQFYLGNLKPNGMNIEYSNFR